MVQPLEPPWNLLEPSRLVVFEVWAVWGPRIELWPRRTDVLALKGQPCCTEYVESFSLYALVGSVSEKINPEQELEKYCT
jgi:hypothetical protein